MASKFLDYTGLSTFWTKVKTWVSNAVTTNSPSASKTVTGWNEGKITYGNIQIAESQVTNLTTDLGNKAPLASPALTGTPTAPTAATGTDTTQIATTAFVNAEIDAKMSESDAMVYNGTIAGGSSGDYGALTPAANKGWTYKVTTAGKIDGVAVEIGDMLICNTDNTAAATASSYSTIKANWDFIQTNIDGAVVGPASAVDGNIVVFDGATGKLIKDSGKKLSDFKNVVYVDTSNTLAEVLAIKDAGDLPVYKDSMVGMVLPLVMYGSSYALFGGSDGGNAYSVTLSNSTGWGSLVTTAVESTANKVTSWTSTTTNTHYPSEKLVKDSLDAKLATSSFTNVNLGQGYGTCTTAAATKEKVVTMSGYTLKTGGIVAVKFTYGLCASATMNINSKGAKNIFINGAVATATTCKMVKAGDIAYFMYDGTQYQFLGTDRMEKDAVTGFSDTGTAGTNAKVQYEKGDGTKGDLIVAITDAEINALT